MYIYILYKYVTLLICNTSECTATFFGYYVRNSELASWGFAS